MSSRNLAQNQSDKILRKISFPPQPLVKAKTKAKVSSPRALLSERVVDVPAGKRKKKVRHRKKKRKTKNEIPMLNISQRD